MKQYRITTQELPCATQDNDSVLSPDDPMYEMVEETNELRYKVVQDNDEDK